MDLQNFSWSFCSAMMMFNVFRATHYFKVFNSIIKSVFIFMMDNFAFKKLSIKMFFHNKPMQKIRFSFNLYANITTFVFSIYCSFSSFCYFKKQWITMSLKSSKVFYAKTFAVVFFIAVINCAFIIDFFRHKIKLLQIDSGVN